MTYQETVDYLYTKLHMFSRIGAAEYKNNLDNIISLSNYLHNPEKKFKSIHVAGTNGKGSTCHMLSAILQQAGYRVGLYTSPHLLSFTERIRINGVEIEEEWVVAFVETHKECIEKIKPSFFEITVAMAFQYFADSQVDIAIIEVGLGGRLDSTNIITPLLSIITNISKDHTNLLGDTIEQIAVEKAGIIKENIPVVIGETTSSTEKVFFNKAQSVHAPIYYAENLYQIATTTKNNCKTYKIIHPQTLHITSVETDLLGNYQQKNIKTVFAAVEILRQYYFTIKEEHIVNALKNVSKITGIRGRFEIIQKDPIIILDVSHNEDGIKELVEQVQQMTYNTLHIVMGFVQDKDIDAVLALFPKEANYYFCNANLPRALPAEKLQALAEKYDLIGKAIANTEDAFTTAKNNCAANDILLVCGSFFIVSEIMQKQ